MWADGRCLARRLAKRRAKRLGGAPRRAVQLVWGENRDDDGDMGVASTETIAARSPPTIRLNRAGTPPGPGLHREPPSLRKAPSIPPKEFINALWKRQLARVQKLECLWATKDLQKAELEKAIGRIEGQHRRASIRLGELDEMANEAA